MSITDFLHELKRLRIERRRSRGGLMEELLLDRELLTTMPLSIWGTAEGRLLFYRNLLRKLDDRWN